MMRRKSFAKLLRNDRGDTLIEVMVAIAVLGMIVVGSLAIMNRANGDVLTAIERTEVRTDINAQTEMLNYIRDMYLRQSHGSGNVDSRIAGLWGDIAKLSQDNSAKVTEPCSVQPGGSTTATGRPGSFYLRRDAANGLVIGFVNDGKNNNARAVPGDGLWIDAVKSPQNSTVPYTDFYIKACWAAPSGGVSQQTSTIVRLYDR